VTLFVLTFVAFSCNSPQQKTEEPRQDLKTEDFPHLQEQLFALSIAQDPEKLAETLTLDYEKGKVWVKIELKSEQDSLPSGYTILVDTRSGNLVQAWVELTELRKLSQEPQIEYISPLQKPQP
jgi:hypothetical protein